LYHRIECVNALNEVNAMCPLLARPEYFLRVLNEPAEVHAQRVEAAGPLAADMWAMLQRLAEHVRDGSALSELEVAQLNRLFEAYSAVQLRLVLEDGDDGPATGGPLSRASLRAVLGNREEDRGKRVYMEALVSLLEAAESGSLALERCQECGAWFIPYSRAAVTRFCSARCRNRHNYKARRAAAGGEVQRDQTEVAP
jgi:hypothetical protein